ncbi:hypothetical protein [Sinorhizobium fredii]|uniref:hypothetical protein n=1 Tax=Rhizobium fredii TaxID=380 RepID=UPI0035124EBB
MRFNLTARLCIAAAMTFALASCTTTQADFSKNPKAVSKAALCRTLVESQDTHFRQQIAVELGRRNINPYDCYAMVQQQNQAAAALVAVAVVGTAVAVCANNNCGGGSYYPSYRGNCQYDWQRDAAGNRCGKRSAYSRPGGY